MPLLTPTEPTGIFGARLPSATSKRPAAQSNPTANRSKHTCGWPRNDGKVCDYSADRARIDSHRQTVSYHSNHREAQRKDKAAQKTAFGKIFGPAKPEKPPEFFKPEPPPPSHCAEPMGGVTEELPGSDVNVLASVLERIGTGFNWIVEQMQKIEIRERREVREEQIAQAVVARLELREKEKAKSDAQKAEEALRSQLEKQLEAAKSVGAIIKTAGCLAHDTEANELYCVTCIPFMSKHAVISLPASIVGHFNYSSFGRTTANLGLTPASASSRLSKLRVWSKSHLETKGHLWAVENKARLDEVSRSKRQQGLNVASTAYECFIEGRSSQAFERQLYYDSLKGVSIGQINHSDAFFFSFRKDVYGVLHERLVNHLKTPQPAIGGRCPPFAIVADKMTALRRTNQAVGKLSIDYSRGCIVPILSGARVVKEHDGAGVGKNMIEVLKEDCMLTDDMLKLQATGQGYDGAYFHCSVPKYVSKLLGHKSEEWTLPGWEIAHQLEVVLNHIRKKIVWYAEMAEKVSRVVSKCRYGKNFEAALVIAERLSIVLRDPGVVCETRFASSERKVYKNVINNWLVFLKLIEQLADNERDHSDKKILREIVKLLRSLAWIVQMMGLIDVLRVVKDTSLFAQTVNALEWEKIAKQRATYDRIQNKLLPQLISGQLLAVDFPYLAGHTRDLQAGVWQNETLVLIPAAGGDAKKAFIFACKNVADLCKALLSEWHSQMLAPDKVPRQYRMMAGCLDLKSLIQSPCPLGAQGESLTDLYSWTIRCNAITELLPSLTILMAQHDTLVKRLQAFAQMEPFKSEWKAELDGGGSSTTIMKHLFSDERFYQGVEDWVFFFNHMVLKTSNEAIVESMGCIIDTHADGRRHLNQKAYAEEAFVHWNGPKVHSATKMLTAALDHHFKGKPWHFVKSDRGNRESALDRIGRNKQFKVSKVVDRLMSERSRIQFLADD